MFIAIKLLILALLSTQKPQKTIIQLDSFVYFLTAYFVGLT